MSRRHSYRATAERLASRAAAAFFMAICALVFSAFVLMLPVMIYLTPNS